MVFCCRLERLQDRHAQRHQRLHSAGQHLLRAQAGEVMKRAIVLLLLPLSAVGFAANMPLEHLGYPFGETNVALVWTAPTNDLPRGLWVYRGVRAGIAAPVL